MALHTLPSVKQSLLLCNNTASSTCLHKDDRFEQPMSISVLLCCIMEHYYPPCRCQIMPQLSLTGLNTVMRIQHISGHGNKRPTICLGQLAITLSVVCRHHRMPQPFGAHTLVGIWCTAIRCTCSQDSHHYSEHDALSQQCTCRARRHSTTLCACPSQHCTCKRDCTLYIGFVVGEGSTISSFCS